MSKTAQSLSKENQLTPQQNQWFILFDVMLKLPTEIPNGNWSYKMVAYKLKVQKDKVTTEI